MLREYAQGAAQSAAAPIADFLAPTVPVSTLVGRFKIYSEKDRFFVPDVRRAIGGRAVQLQFNATDATYNCTPRAIDYPIDNLEALEEAALEGALQEGARAIAEVAALAHELDVVNKAVAGIPGGQQFTMDTTSSSTDCVQLLDNAILSVIKAAKYGSAMGVGIIFGATAFQKYRNHVSVRSRYVVGGGSSKAGPSIITPGVNDVSTLQIGNPEARVSFMVYDSAGEGLAPSINFVLDSKIIVFARVPNPTRRDPSFMKTFRLENQYMVPGSYVRDDGRVEVAKFDWSEDIQLTNSVAAQMANVS